MATSPPRTARYGRAVLALAAVWMAAATPAQAESGKLNAHVDLGLGVPIGTLGGSDEDGTSRLLLAAWGALDYQIAAPWAFELVLGIGYQAELAESVRAQDDVYWQLGVGARVRFLDDEAGYADDAGGNYDGNLYLAAHVGYHNLDGTQFGLDAVLGYEWSVARPVQIGPSLRGIVLFGGERSGADGALILGVGGSFELTPIRVGLDRDNDGVQDAAEAELGTNPDDPDTDHDHIPDGVEIETHTNPLKADTDADGLVDGMEDSNRDGKLDPLETDPRALDTDQGGIEDADEVFDPVLDPRDPNDDDPDGDGIIGALDRCPDSRPETKVAANGCELLARGPIKLEGIGFASGSSKVSPESLPALQRAFRILDGNPTVQVEIAGHTDDTGSAKINLRLSRLRANAVRRWLINAGVEPERLTAKGYGETVPVAPNDSSEGRAKNRRIEFRRPGLEEKPEPAQGSASENEAQSPTGKGPARR